MKNRSRLAIFATIFSVLACFGLAYGAGGPESPDPSPFPVNSNTADGFRALEHSGNNFNSALGWFSVFTDSSGAFNTGIGAASLFTNNGGSNTAMGAAAMFFNTSGSNNTAVGTNALRDNITDSGNTAVGSFALFTNTAGMTSTEGPNTAVGFNALEANTTGNGNVAVGATNAAGVIGVLGANTTGRANTAVGNHSLAHNQTGIWNTAVGTASMFENVSGSYNTAVGVQAGSLITGDHNIDIGQGVGGVAGESNTIRIGDTWPNVAGASACFIGGIDHQTTGALANASFVYIDLTTGKLGTVPSSERFKKDINPMGKTSEAIFSLKPVTFHYKNDTSNTDCFGLIAEEVAKVNPALVAVEKDGKPYTVRYDQINSMLLNEFLKEHKKVEEQQASIAELKSTIAQQQKGMEVLTAQLKEQAAQIQKVSAQLEVSKPAPRTVLNNQ